MRKAILTAIAASSLIIGGLAAGAAFSKAARLSGANETHIECADIVFGTTPYSTNGKVNAGQIKTHGVVLSSATATNAYYKRDDDKNYALRLGTKDKMGTVSFTFAEPYRISKARVYCYKMDEDTVPSILVYTDASSQDQGHYQKITWSEAPDISGVEGENSLTFADLDGEDGLSTDTITIKENEIGRAAICKIVLTLVAEGSASVNPDGPLGEGSIPDGSAFESEFAVLPEATQDYYSTIDFSLGGSELKTSFFSTISDHSIIDYDSLMDQVYSKADVDEDGYLYDIYSDTSKHLPSEGWSNNNSKEGDGMQREHVIPKSYFASGYPMYSDAFSVLPADGFSNAHRNDLPYGEVDVPTYKTTNGSKKGENVYPGYEGTVFEVGDEWKGDVARIHFYFVTCYEDRMGTDGWIPYPMFDYSSPLGLSDWATSMLLKWAEEDPASEREIERNEIVFGIQKNRNPFVDFPSLAEAVFA